MAACVAASALPLRPAPPRAGGRVDTPTHRATRRVHARASAAEKADPAAFVCDDRGACASVDEMKEKEQNAVETRRALKEWGAVVNALAEGDQTVIFRKGGLKDGKGGFKLESRQFGLFPTVYHPKELDGTVSTEASKKFVDAKVPDMKRGEEVPISVVAEVTGAWVTHDASVLDALSDHHVWSRDVLESRLSWKPDTPITVLELRAKKLPAPRVHALPPDLEKYGGCKSWIDLPFSVSSDDYDDDALSPDNIETTVGDTVSSAQSSGALDSTIASEASAAGVTSAIASVSATSVTTSSTTDTDAPNSLTPVPSPPEDTEKGEIPTYLLIAIPVGLLIVCGCCVAMACKSKQASPKASMSPMTQTQQGSAVV